MALPLARAYLGAAWRSDRQAIYEVASPLCPPVPAASRDQQAREGWCASGVRTAQRTRCGVATPSFASPGKGVLPSPLQREQDFLAELASRAGQPLCTTRQEEHRRSPT